MSNTTNNQAAVFTVFVDFDDSTITEWCPATEATIEIVVSKEDAAEAYSIFDALVDEKLQEMGLYRWSEEDSWSNVRNYEITAGYIGTSEHMQHIVIDGSEYNSNILEALETLYNNDYETVLGYIDSEFHGDVSRFEPKKFHDSYLAWFKTEFAFMKNIVKQYSLDVDLIELNLQDSDLRFDYYSVELSEGFAIFRNV